MGRGRGIEIPTAPVPSVTEAQFLRQVIDLASILGWSNYHPWLSRFSPRGFPDLVLVRPPRLIFAELKSETGKVTADQERWLELLRGCGVPAVGWRPSDLDAIAKDLAR